MNKANGAIEKEATFLQHISLKNYKSIKNAEVDFKPGLNVIIGKNASGKTNFISGLDAIFKSDYRGLSDSTSAIVAWFKNNKIEIEIQPAEDSLAKDDFNFQPRPRGNILLKINDKKNDFNKFHDVLFFTLYQEGYIFREEFIRYGVHYKQTDQFIGVPFTFIFLNNAKISYDWENSVNDIGTRFTYSFFYSLHNSILKIYNGKSLESLQDEDFKNIIISFSIQYFENINSIISDYCPISEIRLSPDFKVIIENNSQKLTVTNFYLEFLVDENWLTYSLLSDGTKRLFYIVSEILSYNGTPLINDNDLNIILLEEPELGIHPHQLHQLMQFIKEQAKEKQIILTTHSPQVLDVLEPDELDRIIICYSEPKTGTQLSHLSDQQIAKAKKYMTSEAFLSDYWRFSDLEPA